MEEGVYSAWEEWLNQSDYDFETAQAMFKSERMVYVVFFCHLSIEKILKSLWVKKNNSVPPKTHNLIFLVERLQILGTEYQDFLSDLNQLSIPTRYPESLRKLTKELSHDKVLQFMNNTRNTLVWLKSLI